MTEHSFDKFEKHIKEKSIRKKFHGLSDHRKQQFAKRMSHRSGGGVWKVLLWLVLAALVYFIASAYR